MSFVMSWPKALAEQEMEFGQQLMATFVIGKPYENKVVEVKSDDSDEEIAARAA